MNGKLETFLNDTPFEDNTILIIELQSVLVDGIHSIKASRILKEISKSDKQFISGTIIFSDQYSPSDIETKLTIDFKDQFIEHINWIYVKSITERIELLKELVKYVNNTDPAIKLIYYPRRYDVTKDPDDIFKKHIDGNIIEYSKPDQYKAEHSTKYELHSLYSFYDMLKNYKTILNPFYIPIKQSRSLNDHIR